MPTTLGKRRLFIWDQKVITAQSLGVQLDDDQDIASKLGPMYTSGWFSGGAISSSANDTVTVASAVVCFNERVFTSPACTNVPFPNGNTTVYKLGVRLALRPTVIELNEYVGALGYRYEEWIMGACQEATHVHVSSNTIHLVLTDLFSYGGGTNISWAGRTVRAQLATPLSETDWYEDVTVQYGNIGPYSNVNYITLTGVLGQTDTPSDEPSDYLVSFEGLVVMANDASPSADEVTLLGTVTGVGSGSTPVTFSTTGRTTLYFPSAIAGVASDLAAHIADTTDPHGASMSVSTSITTPEIISTTGGQLRLSANAGVNTVVNIKNATPGFYCDLYVDGVLVALNQDLSTGDCGLQVRRVGGETPPNSHPTIMHSNSNDRWKLIHFTNGTVGWIRSRKTASRHIWKAEAMLADYSDPPLVDLVGQLPGFVFPTGDDAYVIVKLGAFPKDYSFDVASDYVVKAVLSGSTPGAGEAFVVDADLVLVGPSFSSLSLDANSQTLNAVPANALDVIDFTLSKSLNIPSGTYYAAYLRIGRNGTDGADTYSGDVYLTDAWLEYTPVDLY